MLSRLALLAALCVATPGHAGRPGHLTFRHYTSDDGLTALDLVAGAQDRDGFIWAASPNGLFRYDGARFHRFSVEDGLPSTLLTDMAVSPDGVLWGATSRGLFYRRGDRFVTVGVDVLPLDGMHLLAFHDGRAWVTTDAGPYVVTAADTVEPVAGWPGGESFGILVEPDRVLVGHGSRLLLRAGATFADVGHDFVERITSIVRDGSGRLWLRAGQHLWMQPRVGAPFEDRSRSYLGAPVGADGLRLALSATRTLLIPTSVGLIEIDGDDAHFLETDLAEDARAIKSAWVDREGSLWLTSLGLHRELGRGLWRTISKKDGLPVNNVWAIAGLGDGRTAIGTDAGVAIVGGGQPELIAAASVMTVAEQPAGVLWIGTAHGLVRYDLAARQRVELGAGSGLPDRKILVVAGDRDGDLWVGHSSGGLYRARATAAPRFERVIIPDGEDATISGIAFDGERLWVTTSHGLHVRDRGVWHRFGKRQGLRDDGVMFLTIRKNHEICASYLAPYGLSCLRYADGAISALRHIDETSGLSSPVPYFVTEDAAGRLWIGGAQGVTVIDGDTFDYFSRAGGAPGDDCNANAVWAAPGGDVWVGTSSGVGVFEGARHRGVPAPPPVMFERGQLGGKPVDVASPVLHTVPHDRARLDVELATASFIDERSIEVQVRLLGHDDDWQRADSRDVHYAKLPPGSYQLAARARHRNGAWSEPATFGFIVQTPFWQTWWFTAICFAAGLVAVAALVRWRSRALVRRNAELEDIVRARTRDLVAANEKVAHVEKLSALGRLLAQLSHEINNPLNVIHNNMAPLEEYSQTLSTAVTECKELASDDASRARLAEIWQRLDLDYIIDDSVQAFAITKTAIERVAMIHSELKAFLRSEPLERHPTDLCESVRTTVAMMTRALPDVEIRCELQPLPLVLVHPGRIQQILTNLVQNAADAMKKIGRITIRASAGDHRIQISVADSGPGVPRELRSKIFEPFFTTKDIGQGLGLGLSICREIIVAHGGSLELDDSYTAGACFVIALPR
jgi:signal transduction histidine kinase/ligand-binding sensor domain-containing protein